MSGAGHTPGEWLCQGALVYALQHHGWRKGVEQFCNRWSAHVQQGPGATTEEVESVARLIAAAPELLEQGEWNRTIRDRVDALLVEAGYADDSSVRNLLSQMNFDAIAKATGQ